MKTLQINVLVVKNLLHSVGNSYALISLSYVVSLFLILFGFFGVAASQSHQVSVKSMQSYHSSSQNF